jgi:hypothetical protein
MHIIIGYIDIFQKDCEWSIFLPVFQKTNFPNVYYKQVINTYSGIIESFVEINIPNPELQVIEFKDNESYADGNESFFFERVTNRNNETIICKICYLRFILKLKKYLYNPERYEHTHSLTDSYFCFELVSFLKIPHLTDLYNMKYTNSIKKIKQLDVNVLDKECKELPENKNDIYEFYKYLGEEDDVFLKMITKDGNIGVFKASKDNIKEFLKILKNPEIAHISDEDNIELIDELRAKSLQLH